MIKHFENFNNLDQEDEIKFGPIKSFYLKDNLNPKLWKNYHLDEDIRLDLLKIGEDFWDKLEFEQKPKDIILCGSLCNYNWSEKYSDFDVHIILDFNEFDADPEILNMTFDLAKKEWNREHEIKILGFDVELAIQDENELMKEIEGKKMGAVYSLSKGIWIKKPDKINFKPDEALIKKKSKWIMDEIEEIEEEFKKGVTYKNLIERITKIWKKIKEGRRSGLEKGGEFSLENLVFKLIRRNGYIKRLLKIRIESYDKQFK